MIAPMSCAPTSRSRIRRIGLLAGVLAAGSLPLLARARAGDADVASWFPLEVGRTWRYSLQVEIEGVPSTAVDERSIAQKVRYRDRDAFLSQDRIAPVEPGRTAPSSESNVATTETLALEDGKIYLLAQQHAGASEHPYDPPRLFLDLGLLETVGAVWSWQSADGRETLTGKVLENGPFADKRGKIHSRGATVLLTSTYKGPDGKAVATQERKLWLVRGTGIYKEHAVVTPPGSHRTVTDLELEPAPPHEGTGGPNGSPAPTPSPGPK